MHTPLSKEYEKALLEISLMSVCTPFQPLTAAVKKSHPLETTHMGDFTAPLRDCFTKLPELV